eukprot:TRINITY_DN6982_c0_g1_i1.p1 TRINITY_DN6982_c0_g1~~TRINITY_DN6982_c0_g1_i1.p1  ORF type:complete len:754 (-),score=274.35 TRINITY_DN6982_c0_g1_i1:283-2544(-)
MDSIILQKHQQLVNHLEENYKTNSLSPNNWDSDGEEMATKKRGRGRPANDEFAPNKKKTSAHSEYDEEVLNDEKDSKENAPKHHMLQLKRDKKKAHSSPNHKSLSATSSVEWTSMVPGSPDISSSASSLPDSIPVSPNGIRSIPCFHDQCTYSYQRMHSEFTELSDRPLLLPSKFEGYHIRACKKHADVWKQSNGLCEVCRGLNSSPSEALKEYNNGFLQFLLCKSCSKRQSRMLGLKEEDNIESRVSDTDSNCAMSDNETISDRSPNGESASAIFHSKKSKKSSKISEKGERYLDHFEKIEQWNRSNMDDHEANASAFRWFAQIGFEILITKGKVTIPIEFRLPAKKGLANNFKGGNVDELFGRNPFEWGYVVQLEALDLVRAREDCWVTFKAGHDWDTNAFTDALNAWNKKLGEGWAPVILPPVTRNEVPASESKDSSYHSDSHNYSTNYAKNRRDKKKEKISYKPEPIGITSKIEALQMQAERIKPKLDEIPFGDISLINTGDRKTTVNGRHGTIHKGFWKGFPVAVRFPLVKLPISDSDRNSFLKKIERASKVSHPNIITNYACCASEQLCIVSELMNIGNLAEFQRDLSAEITIMYVAKIALDIARGMDYLHSRGILHCNLSPKNINLKGEIMEGGIIAALEVKIADVGFNSSLETRLDSIDPFLAPEVLDSQMHTTFSDVYSFGKILSHLFSGGSEDPMTIDELRGACIESEWLSIIQQCLHSIPEQRPSFGKILNQLGAMSQRSSK